MDELTGNTHLVATSRFEVLEEETTIQIVEQLVGHMMGLSTEESWMRISETFSIPTEQCKKNVSKAINMYKRRQIHEDSKLFHVIKRLETNLDFAYCFENFSSLCRFCFRLKDEDDNDLALIFDDSTEEALNDSNELIEKIHYTLYDNILEKIDFKLSNLICEDCSRMIEEFHKFKKQCDRNADVLMLVKNELDKLVNKSESVDCSIEAVDESKAGDEMENEDEDLSQNSDESFDEENIDEVDENSDELEPSDSNEAVSKSKAKKSAETRKRDRKSYKGKNSQCPICGKLVKGIQMHMLIHTGERRHKCSYCCKSFTQSGQLKRHINSHLNIRNHKCPEPGCERTFVDPSSVTKHLVVHNKEDRKFQCSLCGSRFNRLGALRYHEKTHRQERNHSCDICKKSFLAKYDLTKHYRTHTGEKPYSCKYCDKKFSISKNAKVHLRVHTKEKPYSCNFCDLSFAYRSSMKNHLIKIHNQADASSLPLLQAINIAMRNDSDQNELESQAGLDTNEELAGDHHELEIQVDSTD